MELGDNEGEDRASVVSSHSLSISIGSSKGKAKAIEPGEEEKPSVQARPAKRQRTKATKKKKRDEDEMDVDAPLPSPVSPPKSPCRESITTNKRSKPKSIAPATPKPKSTPLQRSPLSASFMPGSTDTRPPSPAAIISESPTRKARVKVDILAAPGRKGLSTRSSMGSLKKRTSGASINVSPNAKSRAGGKAKALSEIVDTSVDGEQWT